MTESGKSARRTWAIGLAATALLVYVFWPAQNPAPLTAPPPAMKPEVAAIVAQKPGDSMASPASTDTAGTTGIAATVVQGETAPGTAVMAPPAESGGANPAISVEPAGGAGPGGVPAAQGNAIRVLLAPALETTLVSQINGRVIQVNVNLGGQFGKGATLIAYDCDEQSARLRIAQAELDAARQTYEAKLRLQGLEQAGEVEVSLAASAVEKGQAQLALYRAQMGQCRVLAPFSGRAVKISVRPYQGVTAGQPLMELVSSGPLKLRLNVPAKWISWLKSGTQFEVQIDETGKRYPARVTALNGRIDAVSQTLELEAAIGRESPDLLPGMSGTAHFTPPR